MLQVRYVGATVAIAVLLAVPIHAQPAREIRQYNSAYGTEPGTYWDVPYPGQVVILGVLPNETFEFEAGFWEAGVYQGPADIDSIVANENLGDVTITLVGHEGRTYGARNVGYINLSPENTHGHIADLYVRNLGGAAHEFALIAESAGTLRMGSTLANVPAERSS